MDVVPKIEIRIVASVPSSPCDIVKFNEVAILFKRRKLTRYHLTRQVSGSVEWLTNWGLRLSGLDVEGKQLLRSMLNALL